MSAFPTLEDLSEKEWSSQVYELAQLLGWKRYHTYRSKRSPAGFPDETLVRDHDRIVFLELKTEKGKPSEAQKDWLRSIWRAGGEAYIVRPRDLERLKDVLQTRRDPTGERAFRPRRFLLAGLTREELGMPP